MTEAAVIGLPESIPQADLPAQYRAIQDEIDAAMHEVVARGEFILGPAVREFESAGAAYCGARFGIGVGSGTDALYLALRALGVGPGDEVLVPALTFVATATTVIHCGARPVVVDVRPDDLLMDPRAVEKAITPRTRGLIPVHLYGMVADMDGLRAIGDQHGLWILEDAAQAHGATYRGRSAGSLGQAACYSFYPGKNLGAYGDAGAVLTSDPELAERLKLLRDHGQQGKYDHVQVGFCSRLDNLQAAILSVKLRHLATWNAARVAVAERYDTLIGSRLERVGRGRAPGDVFHQYVVRVPGGIRDEVLTKLRARGVHVAVHYPHALHRLPILAEIATASGPLPVAEQAAQEVLSLPLFAEITAEQQERVVGELFAALGR